MTLAKPCAKPRHWRRFGMRRGWDSRGVALVFWWRVQDDPFEMIDSRRVCALPRFFQPREIS